MLREAPADHLAGRDVQRGEERGRPVPPVVVRAALRQARSHRQHRPGAVQGLQLRRFVDAQHHGPLGKVEVQPHDVAHFRNELRVLGQLERLAAEFPNSPILGWSAVRLQLASSIPAAESPGRARKQVPWPGSASLSPSTRDGDHCNARQRKIAGPAVVAERNHVPQVERFGTNHPPGPFPAWKHSNLYAPPRPGKAGCRRRSKAASTAVPRATSTGCMSTLRQPQLGWRTPQGDGGNSRPAGRVREPSAGRLVGGVPHKVLAGGNPGIALRKSLKRGVRTDS